MAALSPSVVGVVVALALAVEMPPARLGAKQPSTPSPAVPRRIVSFVPAATEMLFAIGVGDRLVGVSSFGRFPPAVLKLPQVGGLLDPHVERVFALKPDLVVTYATQRELRTQLDRARVPHFEYVHRDLADITHTLRSLGHRVGAPDAAEALARDMEEQLAAIRTRASAQKRPRALLIIGREQGALRRILASGGYGFLHDLLELAGGDDVMSDIRRESVELSVEAILARAPEVIIELRYGPEQAATASASSSRDWAVLGTLPAVRRGAVHQLQGDQLVVPGPRVVQAASALAAVIRKHETDSENAGRR